MGVIDILLFILGLLIVLVLEFHLFSYFLPKKNFPQGYSKFMTYWMKCIETFPENRMYCTFNCPVEWVDGIAADERFDREFQKFEFCYQNDKREAPSDWKTNQNKCIVSFDRGEPQEMLLCELYENYTKYHTLAIARKIPSDKLAVKCPRSYSDFVKVDNALRFYIGLRSRFLTLLENGGLNVEVFKKSSSANTVPILDKAKLEKILSQKFFDSLHSYYGAPLAVKMLNFLDEKINYLPQVLTSINGEEDYLVGKYTMSTEQTDGLFEKFIDGFELPDYEGQWIYNSVPTRVLKNDKSTTIFMNIHHFEMPLPELSTNFQTNFCLDKDAEEPYVLNCYSKKTTVSGFAKVPSYCSLTEKEMLAFEETIPKCKHNVYTVGKHFCWHCGQEVSIRNKCGADYTLCGNCGNSYFEKSDNICFCEYNNVAVKQPIVGAGEQQG